MATSAVSHLPVGVYKSRISLKGNDCSRLKLQIVRGCRIQTSNAQLRSGLSFQAVGKVLIKGRNADSSRQHAAVRYKVSITLKVHLVIVQVLQTEFCEAAFVCSHGVDLPFGDLEAYGGLGIPCDRGRVPALSRMGVSRVAGSERRGLGS